MNEERSHATIRDYLLVLRRRRLMILGVVLVAAVAAGVLSASQAKVYTAQASLQAQSVSQNAGFAGLVQSSTQLPSETSAQLAQRATRPDVLQEVKATLKSHQSLAQIRSQLSVSQDQQSNFVVMSAHAPTASRAASLANVAASALADVSNRQVQQQFARIAAAQNKAADSLSSKFAGKKFLKLTPDEQTQYLSNARQAATLEGVAAKLEAFSKVVTVASVTTSADEPSSPSSPHPLSSIILGAALGLVIGLLLSWILESIDRRLRRPDETESVYGLPVLGSVGQGALGKVPGADPEAAPLAPFQLLRTNLRFLSRDLAPPRVVLVTSALAEEGKSTVAIGLALAAAASDTRTLLVEADLYRPVHASRLGLSSGPGLSDFLSSAASPQDVVQVHDPSAALVRTQANGSATAVTAKLACITAGQTSSILANRSGAEAFAEMIAEVRQVYDLIVIDTSPLLAVSETSEMFELADAVLLCARLGSTTVEHAKAVRAALSRLPQRGTGLVLTELTRSLGMYYGYDYDYAEPANGHAKVKV